MDGSMDKGSCWRDSQEPNPVKRYTTCFNPVTMELYSASWLLGPVPVTHANWDQERFSLERDSRRSNQRDMVKRAHYESVEQVSSSDSDSDREGDEETTASKATSTSSSSINRRKTTSKIQVTAMDDKRTSLKSDNDEDPPQEKFCNLLAFWVLGFINNVGYVIMIAGAQEISEGGVGIVYACDIFPSMLINLTGPYWYPYVPYQHRVIVGTSFMVLSFLLVAFGTGNLSLQLTGVVFSGIQSGLGEGSFLGLAAFYDSKRCLTCWSSGTGFAGIGGYAWIAIFHLALGLNLKATLLLALVFPMSYLATYLFVLKTSHLPASRACCSVQATTDDEDLGVPIYLEQGASTPTADASVKPNKSADKSVDEDHHRTAAVCDENAESRTLSAGARFRFILTLYPYMVPLAVVYFTEYTIQTGAWSAIGFPVDDKDARATFYSRAGFAYQIGVFLSRSSGVWFQATRMVFYMMPVAQTGLLVYFSLVATYHFMYNWILLVPCFCSGLLGGAVYVNAYTLISKDISPGLVELALSATCVANTFGILFADIAGLFLQGCLYSVNHLSGATIPISCGA